MTLTLLSPGDLKDQGLDALERLTARARDEPAFQRDAAFIEEHLPTVGTVLRRYFASEVRGLEHVPDDGPFLLVGNHSGGFLMPDVWALADALLQRFGVDRVIHPLVFDFALAIPGFGVTLRRLGAVPASMENARTALSRGAGVLVYPGGDWEAYRPWTERNRIDFHGHTGFVQLALREGVPVIPAVSHGSHDSLIVVSRGDGIGRALGLDRLRIRVFPFMLGVPFGLAPVFLPNVPYPAKVVVEVLEPVDWSHHGPGAADDPEVLHDAYEEITGRMQEALDRLVVEMPHPVAARLPDAAGVTRCGVQAVTAPVRALSRFIPRPFR